VLVTPVLFEKWPETGIVVEVMNVLGKPVVLPIVELTNNKKLVSMWRCGAKVVELGDLLGTTPVWASGDEAGDALGENVRVAVIPD
jgi:hypothetical protein